MGTKQFKTKTREKQNIHRATWIVLVRLVVQGAVEGSSEQDEAITHARYTQHKRHVSEKERKKTLVKESLPGGRMNYGD